MLGIAGAEPRKGPEVEQAGSLPCHPAPYGARLANWIGLAFLAGMLALLEFRSPYYFTQDDNLIESLPMILVGCRNIWDGVFPEYNPYLFLGMPLASLGMYSLTYPPLHLSYAIARHILHNENATIEVFAIFHLLVGFFATRLLGRKLGMSPLPANLTALSCVLSGAALIMGRCWFNFIPIVTWMPLLLLGLLRLQRGPVGWLWIVLMGLSFGLTFHVGFTQAAIYLNCFFCLALLFLVLTGSLPWRRAVMVIPALLIGAGLAVPLVYQQWLLSLDVQRFSPEGMGIGKGLSALLLPYPIVETLLPWPIGNVNLHLAGHFYFFGGLLAFLCIFQIVGLFFFREQADLGGTRLGFLRLDRVLARPGRYRSVVGTPVQLAGNWLHSSLSHASHAVRDHFRLHRRRPGAGTAAAIRGECSQKETRSGERTISFLRPLLVSLSLCLLVSLSSCSPHE